MFRVHIGFNINGVFYPSSYQNMHYCDVSYVWNSYFNNYFWILDIELLLAISLINASFSASLILYKCVWGTKTLGQTWSAADTTILVYAFSSLNYHKKPSLISRNKSYPLYPLFNIIFSLFKHNYNFILTPSQQNVNVYIIQSTNCVKIESIYC